MMTGPKTNPVAVITVGFITLLLFSIPLFWARVLCETALLQIMPGECKEARIRPSGLVPPQIENDPNVVFISRVDAEIRWDKGPPAPPGIVDYFSARQPQGYLSNVYEYDRRPDRLLYFDKDSGLLIYHYIQSKELPDGKKMQMEVRLYAGPEGVSEIPDANVGRFADPLDSGYWHRLPKQSPQERGITFRLLYDKKLRRFFAINFPEKTMHAGPELQQDGFHNPLQVGSLAKNDRYLSAYFRPPLIEVPRPPDFRPHAPDHGFVPRPIVPAYREGIGPYTLVLDESGRIDLLDVRTLEFVATVGYLPAAGRLSFEQIAASPKHLFAYHALPVALEDPDNYRGMLVAAVVPEATNLLLTVFDKEGNLIETRRSESIYKYRPRHDVSYKDLISYRWRPILMTGKFLLENLQPPGLSIASYFTADTFEAVAGHRALFFLPNSLVAIKARDAQARTIDRYAVPGLLISPSILLAFFLCWRVNKDALALGLSENARTFWFVFTFAFGLAGYITYRLTRPKIALVTCQSCGRGRRPDMDRCHRCGGKWTVPELTPPDWRVADEQHQKIDSPGE
jgi:hypothetical protein